MINKLKRKFTVLATISIILLMTVLVLIMNFVNYSSVVSESDEVLDVLVTPNSPFEGNMTPPGKPSESTEKLIPRGMSPEVPYESRYFSVTVSKDGEIIDSNLSKIISVDFDSSKQYIEKAQKSNSERGFVDHFRYAKVLNGSTTKILFLDCGRKLDAFYRFLWISAGVGVLGCLIVFFVFLFASGRIVKPIAESYKKQKRFISDAGHEIKTPLTIINANIDLLESDGIENEELSDIRSQTLRLTQLTNDLVFLSKMEEEEHTLKKIDLPLSDLVYEIGSSFNAPAIAKNIELFMRISPNIGMNAAPEAIRQLLSILLENALKYSPNGSIVTLDLYEQKKNIILSVFNTSITKIEQKDLSDIFERFYRTDTSRNSETGGHGIGLSIAKAIAEAHSGSIYASTQNNYDFCITVIFPKI